MTAMLPRGTPSPYPVPADLVQAVDRWRCSCGPAALAALVGMTCEAIRAHVSGYEGRWYMNPTHMKLALCSLGRAASLATAADRWPVTGLAFIQWNGPWSLPGRPVAAAYRHTHWVAVRADWVYDINSDEWTPRWWWEQEIAPAIMSCVRQCSGSYYVRTGYEVTL